MPSDYENTARSLALDPNGNERDENLPGWSYANNRSSSDLSSARDRFMHQAEKIQRSTSTTIRHASTTYRQLSILQRILLALVAIFGLVMLVMFFKFGESVFAWIAPLAEGWREVEYGWMILWAATFVVSFPPLIGYSSCVTLAGFVYGLPTGWLIAATATVVGSTASFVMSRYVLSGFVHRLIAHDRRFNALSLTLKYDGLKLLTMIRLCPLPYSLSNGAIATFPTVHWANFALATTLASPKLLIAVFIGSRLAAIAKGVGEMDGATRALNWIGVLASMAFGVITAWFIYRQTRKRADELEALERTRPGNLHQVGDDDDDDDAYDDDDHHANGGVSNISLREGQGSAKDTYRDEPKNEQ